MTGRHLVVLSVENHAYHSWQAAVATYSCMQWQGQAPLLVVHGARDAPLHPYLLDARAAGAWIVYARNWKDHGRHARPWAARNTAAALIAASHVARDVGAEAIVLMDPDMVWTRRVTWPSGLAVDSVDLDWLGQDRAREVATSLGLELRDGDAARYGARVPYVVPTELAHGLGQAWWHAMAAYYERGDWKWSDQMVAFSMALAGLGLVPEKKRFSQTNDAGRYKAPVEAPLLHYAYETPYWNKRWFASEAMPDWADLWRPPHLPVGSVQGWVNREIRRAGRFYKHLEVLA